MKRFVSILILFVFCSFSVRATADDMRAEITVPTDVATLSEAYAQIAPQGTIQLLRGKHEVPETITITKNVTIIGDVKHPEYVLLEGGVNSVFDVQSGFAEIAGVTIRNGKEDAPNISHEAVCVSAPLCAFHDCIFTSRFGRGFIVNAKDCAPDVQRCTACGCGMDGFCIRSGASGTFRDCTASGNVSAGMMIYDAGSNPTVENCRFIDGKYNGITIIFGASGTFRNCTVSRNAYIGMAIHDPGSNPTVEGCKFTDSKIAGIFVCDGASGTFRKCTASGNGLAGMGVKNAGSNPLVENCTFAKNTEFGVFIGSSDGGTFRKNLFLENEKAAWSIEKGCKVIREENTPNE